MSGVLPMPSPGPRTVEMEVMATIMPAPGLRTVEFAPSLCQPHGFVVRSRLVPTVCQPLGFIQGTINPLV